jgi:hypothetical protein
MEWKQAASSAGNAFVTGEIAAMADILKFVMRSYDGREACILSLIDACRTYRSLISDQLLDVGSRENDFLWIDNTLVRADACMEPEVGRELQSMQVSLQKVENMLRELLMSRQAGALSLH